MAIEQELENLHGKLLALGSARDKLDVVSNNISDVTSSMIGAGESLKRLAEMPELTERVQTSVDRLINASKDIEILSAVSAANASVQMVGAALQSLDLKISQFAANTESRAREILDNTSQLHEEIISSSKGIESLVQDKISIVSGNQHKHFKLTIFVLVLCLAQLLSIVFLVLKLLK